MSSPDEDKTKFNFNYYVVGYMDLLGQRDSLRQFPELTGDNDERKTILELITLTFGHVNAFRLAFQKAFESTSRLNDILPQNILPQQREQFDRMRRMHIRFQYYSDCLAFFISLQPSQDVAVPVYAVFGSLICTGSLFIEFLAKKIPFRGGIEVGTAADFFSSEIYGAALVKAYDLESKVAKQPRIVIGESLIAYLKSEQSRVGNTVVDQIARKMASDSLAILGRDVDGCYILDYMGAGFRDEWMRIPPAPPIQEAYDFVCSEVDRFKLIADDKLEARYLMVRQYMESRLPLWCC